MERDDTDGAGDDLTADERLRAWTHIVRREADREGRAAAKCWAIAARCSR